MILAVKNGERFLEAAIQSIIDQDYRPIEILVVDGKSIDNTPQIAKSFPAGRYIKQSGDGVSDAYNLGIHESRGEFLAFLSHDDIWAPGKLTAQVNFLNLHQEIQYTIGHLKYFLEPGCQPPKGFKMGLLEINPIGRIMETLVVRKSLFARIGLFDTNLQTAEDVDWFARADDDNIPYAVLPEVLLHKRIHDKNISLSGRGNDRYLLTALRRSVERKKQPNLNSNNQAGK